MTDLVLEENSWLRTLRYLYLFSREFIAASEALTRLNVRMVRRNTTCYPPITIAPVPYRVEEIMCACFIAKVRALFLLHNKITYAGQEDPIRNCRTTTFKESFWGSILGLYEM